MTQYWSDKFFLIYRIIFYHIYYKLFEVTLLTKFIGRDTPSSQITEGEEVGQGGGGEEQRQLEFVQPPPTTKQSRFDIDDKFGKFQIKKLMEGE